MNDNATNDTHAASNRRKGLFIAIAASLVLFALAAYRVPLFHDEHTGVIVGITAMHDETGAKSMAVVQLETGAQVFVAMPGDFLVDENINVRVNEGRSLFGRKSHRIIANNE
ncbi:MAG: hypothetical protein WBO73_20815 [Gammaproteobacteria bacterium]